MTRLLAPELNRRVAAIRQALLHEADYAPGWVLAYGRPHEYARARSFPRFSRNGTQLPGRTRLEPDCPKPKRGRCECAPDGSWRAVGGSLRADAQAVHAVYVHTSEVPENGRYPGLWQDALYEKGTDGLWRCTRPYKRALDRLAGRDTRRHLVLERLLDGFRVDRAWKDLGRPKNIEAAALAICVEVETSAAMEARSEYDRRPREWRATTWIDRSDSQRNAEEEVAVA